MSETTTRVNGTRWLAFSAVMVALSTVLSFIKVWQMPLGGSVTLLSMVPICAVGLMYGPVKALPACFVYSVIQMLQGGAFGWGLTPGVLISCLLLDYILPFTCMALSGLFYRNKRWGVQLIGVVIALVFRFVCHLISGAVLWTSFDLYNNPWVYSLVYNGTYMLPELIITTVAFVPLFASGVFFRLRRLLWTSVAVVDEEGTLPERFRPLSPWAYIGYSLLFDLPVAGFVLQIVFALSKKNVNRRNFARSFLYLDLILLLLSMSSYIVMLIFFASLIPWL